MKPALLVLALLFKWQTVACAVVERDDLMLLWFRTPPVRDPGVALAHAEVLAIESETYSVRHTGNSEVYFHELGRWSDLIKERSGIVLLKIISSPGADMPEKLHAEFKVVKFVATPETPWVDKRIVPGKRFLAFFRQEAAGGWTLINWALLDPLMYCQTPRRTKVLRDYFKSELVSDEDIERYRREMAEAEARSKARQPTPFDKEK